MSSIFKECHVELRRSYDVIRARFLMSNKRVFRLKSES